jgi:hypothetical protein
MSAEQSVTSLGAGVPRELRFCQNCASEATDFTPIDISRFDGIAVALRAPCPGCGQTVLAICGRPSSVDALIARLYLMSRYSRGSS